MLQDADTGAARVAFADESFSEHPTAGLYVLAAVVLEPGACDDVREVMLGLRRQLRGSRAGDKLHWNHLARHQQQSALKQVAALPGFQWSPSVRRCRNDVRSGPGQVA